MPMFMFCFLVMLVIMAVVDFISGDTVSYHMPWYYGAGIACALIGLVFELMLSKKDKAPTAD